MPDHQRTGLQACLIGALFTCLQSLNTVPAKMNLHAYLAYLNPSVQMHLYLNSMSSLFELFLVQALLARIHTITFFLARHF